MVRLRSRLRVKLPNLMLTKPVFNPATRQMLVDEYRDEVRKVGELIDRDLSAWLR